jgi:anti-sigma regulatory factor (Ser/Thr protein kinase)
MSDARSSRSPATRVCAIVATNERAELARIAERVDQFGAACGLSRDEIAQTQLVLDELVSNVIKYGYEDDGRHRIHVTVTVAPTLLTVTVDDDGAPFNPLEAPDPDLDLPIDERPVGGLGLFLVRSMADRLEYRREHGRNIVTFAKQLQRQHGEL